MKGTVGRKRRVLRGLRLGGRILCAQLHCIAVVDVPLREDPLSG